MSTYDVASVHRRLPRGVCETCGRVVAVRRNGAAREHHVYLPQMEQTAGRRTRVCEGSGDEARTTCSQCGEPYAVRACGPTHALLASEIGGTS